MKVLLWFTGTVVLAFALCFWISMDSVWAAGPCEKCKSDQSGTTRCDDCFNGSGNNSWRCTPNEGHSWTDDGYCDPTNEDGWECDMNYDADCENGTEWYTWVGWSCVGPEMENGDCSTKKGTCEDTDAEEHECP